MPKVSIVKCDSYDEKKVLDAVTKAIKDISFKIRPKSKVLLKPNVLFGADPRKAITTHPSVLDAVCNILKQRQCEITIAESFGIAVEHSEEEFKKSRLDKVAKKYNARILSFSADKPIKVTNKNAAREKEMLLPELLLKADLVINLPKLKTHTLMAYKGAVKNLFGCIAGGKKQSYHAEHNTKDKFANLLLDIWQNIQPKLTIMDGIVGMEGEGPSNGTPKEIGLILASDNAIAMDLVVERIIGFKGKIPTNRHAKRRKLINENNIEVIGEIPEIKFKPPSNVTSRIPACISAFVLKHIMAYPKVNREKCVKCWTCVNVCPTKAMEKKGFPHCNRKKCIACYCCQEMCPHDAINLEKSALFTNIMRFYNRLCRRKG